MATETAARIQAVWVPVVENTLPRCVRKLAYHPGVPSAMPTIALWTDVVVRFAGSRKRTAAKDQ